MFTQDDIITLCMPEVKKVTFVGDLAEKTDKISVSYFLR